ncbi:hypothetical protein ACXZ9C_10980 [Streptococcus agalactiae]
MASSHGVGVASAWRGVALRRGSSRGVAGVAWRRRVACVARWRRGARSRRVSSSSLVVGAWLSRRRWLGTSSSQLVRSIVAW